MSTAPEAYVTSSDTVVCHDRPYAMNMQLNGVAVRSVTVRSVRVRSVTVRSVTVRAQ